MTIQAAPDNIITAEESNIVQAYLKGNQVYYSDLYPIMLNY